MRLVVFNQAAGSNLRRNAKAEVLKICRDYVETLRRLDMVMQNVLFNDPGLLAEWNGAKKIPARRSGQKPVEPGEADQNVSNTPAATDSSAPAPVPPVIPTVHIDTAPATA